MRSLKAILICLLLFVGGGCFAQSHNLAITQVDQALEYLYKYMPLPDSVDYPRDFWIKNIEATLQARQEMSWGKRIPEREFRHFVLPVRVNNENMDHSRTIFYEQLRSRLQGLTMEQAVLEVNHWCHERVTYTPSDERTSSPLATIRTAYGRCGEESTLLVAALRAVCIPARQVYTPRWAHTDDNHAWVEAWVDGKWRFLGACEPEPVLDLGWFNAPASRSMLMHTKVFGHYDGPEDVIDRTRCYTEIAVTDTYAPVLRRSIKVLDENDHPVQFAAVEFKIYNYAEFYTFATKYTNSEGLTSIQAGLGDLIVWAHYGQRYGFARCDMSDQSILKVKLEHTTGENYSMDMEIVPPKERNTIPSLTDEQRARNTQRLAVEDAMRNAYVGTFPSEQTAGEWAANLGLPRERVARLMRASRGNYETISKFLGEYNSESSVRLLETLSEKDLRDVPLNVLKDHARYGVAQSTQWSDTTYYQYIRCPRVANELLTPYRGYLQAYLPAKLQKRFEKNGARSIMEWIARNIKVDETSNPQSLRMRPIGVWNNRQTDSRSRDIFFVSLCRTMGYPARIDAVTGKVQYMEQEGQWQDATFEKAVNKIQVGTGEISLSWETLQWNNDPKYYTHFTLSQIKNGSPLLMNYPEDGKWSTTLSQPQQMDAGDYLLTSGTRMADGSVLVHLEVRSLVAGQHLSIPLTIREPQEGLQVIGNLNSEALFQPLQPDEIGKPAVSDASGKSVSILSTTGRGYYVLGFISPSNEPTNHTLRDLAAARDALEQWGGHIVLLFRNSQEAERFANLSDFSNLPANTHFGIDSTGQIYEELSRELRLTGTAPTFVIADTFNRVVFLHEGYTIGLGERLARYLK